jgi:hypothetical protein
MSTCISGCSNQLAAFFVRSHRYATRMCGCGVPENWHFDPTPERSAMHWHFQPNIYANIFERSHSRNSATAHGRRRSHRFGGQTRERERDLSQNIIIIPYATFKSEIPNKSRKSHSITFIIISTHELRLFQLLSLSLSPARQPAIETRAVVESEMTRIVCWARWGNERRQIIDENEWNDEGIIKESSAISSSERNWTKKLRNEEKKTCFSHVNIVVVLCVCVEGNQ